MKHYSTLTFRPFFLLVFILGWFDYSFAGNTCGSPTAITVGNCSTTTVNGNGDAQSPAMPAACTGIRAREEWWSVTLTAGTTYTVSYITTTNDNPAIDIYSGACGSLTYQTCVNNTGTGNPILEELVFTPGATATYLIRVINYNSGDMDGRLCVYTKATNDEPNTATVIIPSSSCSYSTYTNAGATSSTCGTIPAPSCGTYLGGDVWFSVTIPSSGSLTIQGNDDLVVTNGDLAAYTGTACGVLTQVGCNDNSGPGSMPLLSLTGLTPGNTLYIRFWENGNNNNGTFSLCVFDACVAGAPANDNCENAVTLNSFNSSCSTTDGTISCATASPDANTCADTDDDDDVWYQFVATTTSVNITLTSVSGSVTDLYHVVYSGACGSLTSLNCSDPNSSIPTGLTIGQTYFIRVYTTTATAGQNTTFKICVTEMTACGNPANNDYCSTPASLTLDPSSSFNSSTASTYTIDNPGTPSADNQFCGQIHNNSWYKFDATATTATFNISSVFNCPDDGIQAVVYEVTHDASGCCSAFNDVSNCFNPGSVTGGTVTATGLTIGNEYILMIDGYSGANCDYTITGWSATSVLPIELIDFTGKSLGNANHLKWKTATETNNSHFVIERSYDGESFGGIAVVQGAGNSNNHRTYTYIDHEADQNVNVYYRLRQVDLDGNSSTSHIIVVYPHFGNMAVFYPNPSSDILNLDVLANSEGKYTVRTISVTGTISDQTIQVSEGLNTVRIHDFTNLEPGIYFFQILDQENQILKSEKIIKE